MLYSDERLREEHLNRTFLRYGKNFELAKFDLIFFELVKFDFRVGRIRF